MSYPSTFRNCRSARLRLWDRVAVALMRGRASRLIWLQTIRKECTVTPERGFPLVLLVLTLVAAPAVLLVIEIFHPHGFSSDLQLPRAHAPAVLRARVVDGVTCRPNAHGWSRRGWPFPCHPWDAGDAGVDDPDRHRAV